MVEIKTTRSHKIDGLDFIAIKKSEYVNSVGKRIENTIEEHDLTIEEINKALKEFAPEKIKETEESIKKQMTEVEELEEEIKEKISSKEYLSFKEVLESEETKKLLEIMGKEKSLNAGKKHIDNLQEQLKDIKDWEVQMINMKKEIESLQKVSEE